MTIVFYTRRGCHLCDAAEQALRELRRDCPFALELRDVDTNEEWRELYGLLVPVTVLPNGDELHYRVEKERVREAVRVR